MSSNYPYVSDEYRHLLNYQQHPHPSPMRNNPIVYHANYQQYPNIYQSPNVYIRQQQQQQYYSQQQQQYSKQANFRYNHDSYAAEQPNNRFSQYPTLQPAKQSSSTPTIDDKTELIHKVQYGDTLQGLSLLYDVAISKIKQRNNIQGDSIYYLKEIIIPNPKVEPLQGAKTQQFFIQQFMTYMPLSEKSQKIARYYLQEHDWNIEAGVKAFKEDLQWQKKNKVQYKSIPVNQKQKNSILNYTKQELIEKKYQ